MVGNDVVGAFEGEGAHQPCSFVSAPTPAVFTWAIAVGTGGASGLTEVSKQTWIFLLLSGVATGLSWLCYFRALQIGDVTKVAPIDKLSVVIAIALAALFLGEHLTWRHGIGAVLIVTGTVIIAKT